MGAGPRLANAFGGADVKVTGTVRVPGDKSLSHRALILPTLAEGRSRIRGLLDAADVRSTAAVLGVLGASLEWRDGEARIDGRGRRGLRAPSRELECGNSGTTARLLAGVVAGHPFSARFLGDASLSRRPMKRIKQPLEAMGATVELERGDGLPMVVRGAELHSVVWETPVASAQTKSAILLGAVVAGVRAELLEPAPSRDHTERMLAAMGAPVVGGRHRVVIDPTRRLDPLDFDVPGDPSSAAFLVGLALMAEAGELELSNVALNGRRIGFLQVARRMGGIVQWETERDVGGEPVGTIHAKPSTLRGITIDGADVPAMIDELVLVACLGACADGVTEVRGAAELRVKESDRIATVVQNLRAVGAQAEETTDGFVVHGSRTPLRGMVRTHGDHRVAMAFGVLSMLPGNGIDIDDRGCVEVSYPQFWDDLERLTK
jgi:3-phosphoshikimate 1-carboxyvinyltransferase